MKNFQENVLLADLLNYRIGGVARFFFAPKNDKELIFCVKEAKDKKLKILILGGGTNILMNDNGFDGLVIKPDIRFLKCEKDNIISVGAGNSMSEIVDISYKKSLSGFEWAGGLPGFLGGAIRGNAGCFGGETKDSLVSVRSFDMKTMSFRERTNFQCKFGYRDSIFRKEKSNEIIVSAKFKLKKGDKKQIAEIIKKNIYYRVTHHPMEYPNAGSVFKNVPLKMIYKEGSKKYKDAVLKGSILFKGSNFSVKTDPFPVISVAKLISECGLCGISYNSAMISPKHPNFIVNTLNATASDVLNLISLAKNEVKNRFGVELKEEIEII
jgi:UDP-N-acetylmuramate dehydrogenase